MTIIKSGTGQYQHKYAGDTIIITVSNVGANKSLGSITLPSLAGRSISKAYAALGIVHLYETSSANNYVDGTTYIQVDSGAAGYTNAIKMTDDMLRVTADQVISCCGEIMGSSDISSKTTFGAATDFQWTLAKVLGASYIMAVYPILYLVVN